MIKPIDAPKVTLINYYKKINTKVTKDNICNTQIIDKFIKQKDKKYGK